MIFTFTNFGNIKIHLEKWVMAGFKAAWVCISLDFIYYLNKLSA